MTTVTKIVGTDKIIMFWKSIALGFGPLSAVYKGEIVEREKTYNVAVKKILKSSKINFDQIEKVKKWSCQNVVSILAVEQDEFFLYVAMELCVSTLLEVINPL